MSPDRYCYGGGNVSSPSTPSLSACRTVFLRVNDLKVTSTARRVRHPLSSLWGSERLLHLIYHYSRLGSVLESS